MEASPDTHGVLACLTFDHMNAGAVLAEASRLAEELKVPLTIIYLYPADWRGPLRSHPSAWHLKSNTPAVAVSRFAARNRITHVVFTWSDMKLVVMEI